MYKVLNKGKFVTMIDEPRFVRKNDNDVWVQCEEKEAECISIHGDLYDLAETSIIIYTAADYMAEQANNVEKNAADIAYIAMMCDVDIPD